MADHRPRLVDPLIDELNAELPALLLVGPGATGKTTTSQRPAATAVRLDREAEAAAFRADPDAALRDLAEPVLFDEWRAVPSLLAAVKRATDTESGPADTTQADDGPVALHLLPQPLGPRRAMSHIASTLSPGHFPLPPPDLRGTVPTD